MKSEEMAWTWSLLLITFSISLPSVLRRKIEQNAFEELYKDLFSFGITMDMDFLKCIS